MVDHVALAKKNFNIHYSSHTKHTPKASETFGSILQILKNKEINSEFQSQTAYFFGKEMPTLVNKGTGGTPTPFTLIRPYPFTLAHKTSIEFIRPSKFVVIFKRLICENMSHLILRIFASTRLPLVCRQAQRCPCGEGSLALPPKIIGTPGLIMHLLKVLFVLECGDGALIATGAISVNGIMKC